MKAEVKHLLSTKDVRTACGKNANTGLKMATRRDRVTCAACKNTKVFRKIK